MTEIADTKQHKVFHVSSRGPALIVTPQGDSAGFGHADLKVERERVAELVQQNELFPNLVVDLGDCNYAGSEMIGFLNKIILLNRDSGGSHAVVNISADMQEGIEIMHLEQIWNVEDESSALRKLARENVVESARRNARVLGIALASLALVAVAVFVWSRIPPNRNLADYQLIAESWNEFQRRRQGSDAFALAAWKKNELPRMQAVEARLAETAKTRYPAQQHMLWALRDHLPRIYDPNLKTLNEEAAAEFVEEMRAARLLVEAQYDVELPVVKIDRVSEEPGGDPAPLYDEKGFRTDGSDREERPVPEPVDPEPAAEPGTTNEPDTTNETAATNDAESPPGDPDATPEVDVEASEPQPIETP